MISYIWAQAKNGIIGKNGQVPWNEPADMHHFVKLTTHHIILSGLTTFKSYGRPTGLPHRTNLVLSKTLKKAPQGVIVFHTLNDFLKYAKAHSANNIMVCGGRRVYQELLPYVDRLYETIIDSNIDGDTKATKINYDKFKLINEEKHSADKRNPYPYIFKTYQRI